MKVLFAAGLALLMTLLSGCSEPPVPPEVQLAINQQQDLWRAGAPVYAPDSYAEFVASLKTSRDEFTVEKTRLTWFRDYERVTASFRAVLARGEQVRIEVATKKAEQNQELLTRSASIAERLRALRDLTAAIKDSRLNSGRMSRIEVLLAEASGLAGNGRPELALDRLAEADELLDKAVGVIRPKLAQFLDERQIAAWKALVDAAIAESRRTGGQAIVVNKLRRKLVLYSKGVAVETYTVGLGFNPIGDKLYSGDRATPEGRYQVVKKLPYSKFFRALLINYPNAEDQRRFAEAKRRKQIPAGARIGGSIEIHGGGTIGATLGCVGLDDKDMLDLFNRVEVGTPVVIVAATNSDNAVRFALGRLK